MGLGLVALRSLSLRRKVGNTQSLEGGANMGTERCLQVWGSH